MGEVRVPFEPARASVSGYQRSEIGFLGSNSFFHCNPNRFASIPCELMAEADSCLKNPDLMAEAFTIRAAPHATGPFWGK